MPWEGERGLILHDLCGGTSTLRTMRGLPPSTLTFILWHRKQ